MNVATTVSEPRSTGASLAWLLVAAGIAAVAWYAFADPTRAFTALLTAGIFTASLSLGAAILIATQGAAGATWWYPIQNVALLMTRTLIVPAAALAAVFVFGLSALYPWARPEVVEASHLIHEKAGWLNTPFFLARAIVVFLIWFGTLAALRKNPRAPRTSIVFLILLAPTLSIASWDWIMSLEPEWFSTMYGVYLFSGAFVAGIATVVLLCLYLEGTPLLPVLDESRRHDLGKLMFAFSAFWAYIWFCEAMLIWYSNIPEETTHFAARLSSGWTILFWLNPILSFVVPFVALMSVNAKKHRHTLFHVCIAVLIGRWLDAYLLVWPSTGAFTGFPVLALLTTATLLAAMTIVFNRYAAAAPKA